MVVWGWPLAPGIRAWRTRSDPAVIGSPSEKAVRNGRSKVSRTLQAARLASVQVAFKGCEQDIMRMRTPGFMRMLAYSNRYLIPVQAGRYNGQTRLVDAS